MNMNGMTYGAGRLCGFFIILASALAAFPSCGKEDVSGSGDAGLVPMSFGCTEGWLSVTKAPDPGAPSGSIVYSDLREDGFSVSVVNAVTDCLIVSNGTAVYESGDDRFVLEGTYWPVRDSVDVCACCGSSVGSDSGGLYAVPCSSDPSAVGKGDMVVASNYGVTGPSCAYVAALNFTHPLACLNTLQARLEHPADGGFGLRVDSLYIRLPMDGRVRYDRTSAEGYRWEGVTGESSWGRLDFTSGCTLTDASWRTLADWDLKFVPDAGGVYEIRMVAALMVGDYEYREPKAYTVSVALNPGEKTNVYLTYDVDKDRLSSSVTLTPWSAGDGHTFVI